jgi:hypothetical protein
MQAPLTTHHHHTATRHAMDHATPTTDIDALMAEVDALLLEDAAQTERIEALLAQPIHRSITTQLADLAAMSQQAQRELAVQERYQRRIARALEQAGD